MAAIVIIGASEQAKVVIDVVECGGTHTIAGLVDARVPAGSMWCGYAVLGTDAEAAELWHQRRIDGALIAIGDNATRAAVAASMAERAPDLPFVTAVHPSAVIARDVVLGPGTVVMAGAVINPGTTIGAHVIINTRASIDHDNTLGDCSSVAPGVTTGGKVAIGQRTAIGVGANLIHGIAIGDDTVVGAGAAVVSDLPSNVLALGVPARVARVRARGERYL